MWGPNRWWKTNITITYYLILILQSKPVLQSKSHFVTGLVESRSDISFWIQLVSTTSFDTMKWFQWRSDVFDVVTSWENSPSNLLFTLTSNEFPNTIELCGTNNLGNDRCQYLLETRPVWNRFQQKISTNQTISGTSWIIVPKPEHRNYIFLIVPKNYHSIEKILYLLYHSFFYVLTCITSFLYLSITWNAFIACYIIYNGIFNRH